MRAAHLLLGAGGAAIAAVLLVNRKADQTRDAVLAAVAEEPAVSTEGSSAKQDTAINATISFRLTGYWPFEAKAKGKGEKMEGGLTDRKGKPLHTVEDFLAGKAEYVSLSGDDTAFPYGQLVLIPWLDGKTIKGRVVDTGGHFRGKGKVYRAMGNEPIDVCVATSSTKVPEKVKATIVRGDHFDKKGKALVASKFQGQQVQVGCGLDLLGCDA